MQDNLLKKYPFKCVLSLKPLVDYLLNSSTIKGLLGTSVEQELAKIRREAPELLEPGIDKAVLNKHREHVIKLMGLLFPALYWDREPLAAVVPFSIEPVFISPPFERLFFGSDGSIRTGMGLITKDFDDTRAIRVYLFILEKFYGVYQRVDYPIIRMINDPDTGLVRYFKFNLDFRFVEVRSISAPKRLSASEKALILKYLTEPEKIKHILPPEEFEFQGLTIAHAIDVTESEVLVAMERDLIDHESILSYEGFKKIQERLRTLLHRKDLSARLAAFHENKALMLNEECEMRQQCIFINSQHVPMSVFESEMYNSALNKKEIIQVYDILDAPVSEDTKKEARKLNIRSLLIIPLFNKGEKIGLLELCSPRAGELGPMEAMVVKTIQPLFSMAIKRALDELEHKIQGIIKEKCTAIHPTVEWRFRQAAISYLEGLKRGGMDEIEPVVFRGVYPLYGSADIRGSSKARNKAIQNDLTQHIELGLKVLNSAYKARPLPILLELSSYLEKYRDKISKAIDSGDEISLVRFMRQEVEPVFSQIFDFSEQVKQAIDEYRKAIDPNMGTVYRLRREFEESVALLTTTLSAYLDDEEKKAQEIFPHYFEKHRTDGVDYVIYVGSSLIEDGERFREIYARDLRLWQMKLACGMALETARLHSHLKAPLEIASLILVQHAPLSIRFRFDEKRFDVDGAYDIRYEILKSRIDKAMVKGTRERLTQPGKLAIVYSQPEEAQEILQHIQFLKEQKYFTGDTESLDLEDLPAVRGLKAFRVEINLRLKG